VLFILAVDKNGWRVAVWAGSITAIIVCIYAIAKLLGSLVKIASTAEDVRVALPTLLTIATQLSPESLGDDSIVEMLKRIEANAEKNKKHLTELWNYSHQFKHDIVTILTTIALGNELLAKLRKETIGDPDPPPDDYQEGD
jgi:hypothetical protein